MRYARRVAFLSLFNIARQIVYPPRLPLYRFSRSRIPVECYGPCINSSTTTGKRHKQASDGGAGGAGTSRAMGRGVAESYNVTRPVWNVGT